MNGELIINGKDAYTIWGIRMGDGFMNALLAPSTLKPMIENKSRLEHGKRVIVHNPRIEEREITLSFAISAQTSQQYHMRRDSFYAELYKGNVEIRVPALGGQTYRLIYQGKSSTYAENRQHTHGSISIKFIEPNPQNR